MTQQWKNVPTSVVETDAAVVEIVGVIAADQGVGTRGRGEVVLGAMTVMAVVVVMTETEIATETETEIGGAIGIEKEIEKETLAAAMRVRPRLLHLRLLAPPPPQLLPSLSLKSTRSLLIYADLKRWRTSPKTNAPFSWAS
jgi:hypothetical protein